MVVHAIIDKKGTSRRQHSKRGCLPCHAKPYGRHRQDSSANARTAPSFQDNRSYGTFPRVLGRYARDEHVVPLEDAIRKMTSLTAKHLRLADRGEITIGAWADLVVFDAERVRDMATYEDPHRYPEGIEYVVVNGGVALERGETAPERHGRFLRLGRDMGGA